MFEHKIHVTVTYSETHDSSCIVQKPESETFEYRRSTEINSWWLLYLEPASNMINQNCHDRLVASGLNNWVMQNIIKTVQEKFRCSLAVVY